VVLNQNYFSGWRVKGIPETRAIFWRGKVGVPVPAGHHHLKVYFWPRTFLWGLLLTLATGGLCLWFLWCPFRQKYLIIGASLLFVVTASYGLFGLQSPPQFQTVKEALDKDFAGDLEGAVLALRLALEDYPDSYPLYHRLGLVLTKLNRFPEAVKYYRKALQLWPHWQEEPYYFGLAFYHCGHFREALDSFREARRRFPDHFDAANALAWLLATSPDPELRDGDEALQIAKEVCETTDYSNAIALDTLAAAYAEADHFQKAAEIARQAIKCALSSEQRAFAEAVRKRLEGYQAQRAYRGPARHFSH
jgi:tetratricopeptide (TPR) repeat protein